YVKTLYSGKFRQFNYGFQRNLRIYRQFTPPDYDLGKVTAPITLIYSSGDKLADLQDVEQLIDRLPNVYDTIFINDPQFQHMDFMTNPDLDTVIYDEIISSMRTNDVMMDLGFSDTDMAFNFNDLEKIDTVYDDEGIVILEEHIFAQNKKIIIFKSVDSGNDCDWNSGHDDINKESDDISYSNNCNIDSKVPSNVKVVILKESVVKFQKKVIFLNREGGRLKMAAGSTCCRPPLYTAREADAGPVSYRSTGVGLLRQKN
ncbi:unnamed protein product, partial [Timema podura]|nr:unnamed protein product [Timema podura]